MLAERIPSFTCVSQPVPSGATCNDGDLCTQGDSCADGGVCVGTPRTCPSPGMCRVGACNPQDGGCVSQPMDAGTPCTTDNNVCTDDVCDPSGNCAHRVVRNRTCPGGACASDGGCVANNFPFDVSNIDEERVPGWYGANPIACDVTATTSHSSGRVAVTSSNCLSYTVGDTWDSHVMQQADGSEVMVLPRTGPLTYPAGLNLRFIGARPLVIMVRGNLTIGGTISVSSPGTTAGAGVGTCTTGNGASVNVTGGPAAAGAGGGGFGEAGGAGSLNGLASALGAPGGAEGTEDLQPLRGGCRGGSVSFNSGTVGGGLGGGSVQISVSGTLTISGRVSANGGGGTRGMDSNRGGAGAGSGGAILLEGASAVFGPNAIVSANGGGGGQGDGSGSTSSDGEDGVEDTRVAAGGATASHCGDYGGNGGARAASATGGRSSATACSNPGGGGGGGGRGRVRINAVNGCTPSTARISPVPSGACP